MNVGGSAIIAYGAVSPLGRGRAAFAVPAIGERAHFRGGPVEAFRARGVRLATANVVDVLPGAPPERRPATLLDAALADCLQMLDAGRPLWRTERIGLALGTSSGGMVDAEALFLGLQRGEPCDEAVARGASYGETFVRTSRGLGVPLARGASVLVACAASTVAIGLGHTWLEIGACDVVLAGGFDALSLFVAAGFSSLSAVCHETPRPFRGDRDGLALAEGAAMLALVRAAEARTSRVFVRGFGVSSDATHVTAPDRTGAGLASAARQALRHAAVAAADIDLVSAHGTATPFNDAAEARALRLVGVDFTRASVHAAKGALGHALGAAGVLETLSVLDAMERGIAPATAGGDDAHAIDPDAAVPLLDVSRESAVRHALKLSAAFGGVNAALVLSDTPETPPIVRSSAELVWGDAVQITDVPPRALLAAQLGIPLDRLRRVDDLGALVLGAVLAATSDEAPGWLADKALLVQSAYASVGCNERFFRRILERGAAVAEARRFPGTSPNLAAGEASILLGIRGPVLTIGGDPDIGDQASVLAEDLVNAGHAEAAIVVAVDEASPAAEAIAYATGHVAPKSAATARIVRRAGR